MARFSFGIFGQGSGDLQPDLAIQIKTYNTATVIADTAGGVGIITITDNGDGTYFADDLPSGTYDIYVAGALQDEMSNQLVLSGDVTTHLNDAGKHRLIQDDGTGSGAGNGNTTTLWSGNQIHDWTHANFEGADSTLLKEGEVDGSTLVFSTTLKIKDGGVTEAKLGSYAVTSGKIAGNAVTNLKMADNAINTLEIVDSAVTTGKIADLNVTQGKIANQAIGATKIAHHSGYGVLLFGATGEPTFGQLTGSHIEASAVTTAKINAGAVTAEKIGASAVETAKIATSAVTTGKILDGNVTTAKLEAQGVTSAKIKDGDVTEAKITENAVGADKIKHHSGVGVIHFNGSGVPSYGTAVSADIGSSEIKLANMDTDSVDTSQIKANAVTDSEIYAGAVTNAKIGASAVDTTQLASSAVTANKISADAVDASKMAHHNDYGVLSFGTSGVPVYGKITGNHIDSASIAGSNIGTGQIGTTQLADASVTLVKLGADVEMTTPVDSVDDTHLKLTAGVGDTGSVSTWSAGASPTFLTHSGTNDELRWERLQFHQQDFDTDTTINSGNVAGQQIKINQQFTSENYISSEKNLNENMDILDQRLGFLTQFSGTEGLYLVLASGTWSHNIDRDGNGDTVTVGSAFDDMAMPKIVDGTDTSAIWEQFHGCSFYKVPDIRQLALYVRSRVSSSASNFSGYFRMRVESPTTSTLSESSNPVVETGAEGTKTAVYQDMTQQQNYNLYKVWCDMMFDNDSTAGTKEYELLDWCVVAKRQITIVTGQSTGGDDSPL